MPTTATLENIVTTTPFCEKFGVARSAIPRLVEEGLPAFKLDTTRWVFPLNECEAWLREHGYLRDPYRAHIKRLVDAAPPLTAEQAAKDSRHPRRCGVIPEHVPTTLVDE